MDFGHPKVYVDTSIFDGLVLNMFSPQAFKVSLSSIKSWFAAGAESKKPT